MIPIFIETDLHDDVDDVGALAVAHTLARAGAVDLLGINVNTTSVWGPRLVSAINRYYGVDTPIGVLQPPSETLGPQEFVRATSRLFGTDTTAPVASGVTLLRHTFAAAGERGVTMVSLGFFGNLTELLDSGPDAISPLSGAELARRSIARTVVMGGCFAGADQTATSLPEYNFADAPNLTREFLREWPGPIDFIGWEVGQDVITGRELLKAHGRESPVFTAYQLHSGYGTGRPSWDLIAVFLAVCPEWPAFDWSAPGTVSIDHRAVTVWNSDPHGDHRFAVRRHEIGEIARVIDHYLLQPSRFTARQC